jgi:hypothetical protein
MLCCYAWWEMAWVVADVCHCFTIRSPDGTVCTMQHYAVNWKSLIHPYRDAELCRAVHMFRVHVTTSDDVTLFSYFTVRFIITEWNFFYDFGLRGVLLVYPPTVTDRWPLYAFFGQAEVREKRIGGSAVRLSNQKSTCTVLCITGSIRSPVGVQIPSSWRISKSPPKVSSRWRRVAWFLIAISLLGMSTTFCAREPTFSLVRWGDFKLKKPLYCCLFSVPKIVLAMDDYMLEFGSSGRAEVRGREILFFWLNGISFGLYAMTRLIHCQIHCSWYLFDLSSRTRRRSTIFAVHTC